MSGSKEVIKVEATPIAKDKKRVKWVNTRIDELSKIVDTSYVELTELIYESTEGEYFKEMGFSTFEEYVRKHLGWKERKGWYFASIYKKLIKGAKLPKEDLSKIGWVKASKIASLPSAELKPGKVEKWVENAEDMTNEELDIKVRKAKISAGEELEGATEEPAQRKTFALFTEQLKNVDLALEIAQKIAGSDKPGHLLDMIALSFNAERVEEVSVKIDRILSTVERVYGVNVIAIQIKGTKHEVIYGEKFVKKQGWEDNS